MSFEPWMQAGVKLPFPGGAPHDDILQGLAAFLPFKENWAIIFPKPFLPFLAPMCQCHTYSIPQMLGEGSSDIQFSRTQKSLCCRLRAWTLSRGAPNWSCKGLRCVPWMLHSSQVLSCCFPLLWWEKGKRYRVLTYTLFPKHRLLPLGMFRGEDGRACREVLWYTVIILFKVFSMIWIFSTIRDVISCL